MNIKDNTKITNKTKETSVNLVDLLQRMIDNYSHEDTWFLKTHHMSCDHVNDVVTRTTLVDSVKTVRFLYK